MLLDGLISCISIISSIATLSHQTCSCLDQALKIADFGLARVHDHNSKTGESYTHQVATRWYRAPELLFEQGVTAWCRSWQQVQFS